MSLKKILVRFFKKIKGTSSTRTLFIETHVETKYTQHLQIDCICVPQDSNSNDQPTTNTTRKQASKFEAEDEQANLDESNFDLELLIQKTLTDCDNEWDRSTGKEIIDTKSRGGQGGNLQKCLPSKGSFSFVHVDFDGEGGMAHIIENVDKFDRLRLLESVAKGIMGNVLANLRKPLKWVQAVENAKRMSGKFSEFVKE